MGLQHKTIKVFTSCVDNCSDGFFNSAGIHQVEVHQSAIGFVHQPGTDAFQYDRKSKAAGRGYNIIRLR